MVRRWLSKLLGGHSVEQIPVPHSQAAFAALAPEDLIRVAEVVLLVDGDAVGQLGWPSQSVAARRIALVTYLSDLSRRVGASPDVVFDGNIEGEETLPRSRVVRIRLSTPPTPPSAAIVELSSAYPGEWPMVAVSDDPDVRTAAGRRPFGTSIAPSDLLDLFMRR